MPWYIHLAFAFIVFMCGSAVKAAISKRNFKEVFIAIVVACATVLIYPGMVANW